MKNLKILVGALSMLTLGAANASTLVLDSFNYNPALDLNVNSGATVAVGSVTSAETFANVDYRLEYTSLDNGATGVSANVSFESEGQLSYAETSFGDGTLNIDYTLGGGVLDFTGFSDFYFDVVFIDDNGGFQVLLTLEDDDGTEISATYNVASTGIYLASFATMMAGMDFDFSKVARASAFISSDGVSANDFTLDSVGLVPAPASLALLGLGLLGLGLRSRKVI